ncbi:MAG: alanine--tRNA ligase, partial [Cytophagaceae bacterium]|nr:alanine--tRNA ligase [Cytophagaceae bacterium]
HIDLRSDEEVKRLPGKELVNQSDPLVIEIWNNVFIQYNRLANGSLESLPAKHVDTGMGFERLCMAIQKKTSNYDTDVFQPTIQYIAKQSGKKYGMSRDTDIAIRVLADHIRAISFTIADGQLPSNTGAGYVIRRILRRAVRYQYTFLDFKEPFLNKLVPIISDQFAEVFPELKAQQDFVQKVILEEENSFLRTLDVGLKKLEQIRTELKGNTNTINGKVVFELYDTFGFPLDLTALIASEYGLKIDEDAFNKEMAIQKERSRKATETEAGDWKIVKDQEDIEFVGYESLTSKSRIVKYRNVKAKGKDQFQIVLDATPFYAESGGQVGDTGYLQSGKDKIQVLDTKKENNLIIHFTDKLPSDVGVEFDAIVNEKQRRLTENNHSATHLLHAALKKVLGSHVNQKGSFVNDKVLRFDFSHISKMSEEEIAEVERIVNEKIREDIHLDEKRNVPIEEAKKLGAMALFGEKYGDFVRVITFDSKYSIELCGGTHVPSTGKIGYFKILSESSVAAGVRRIEAVTAEEAEKYVNGQVKVLEKIKEILKNPADLVKAVEGLLEEKTKLQKLIEEFQNQQAQELKKALQTKAENVDGINYIIEKVEIASGDAMKNIAFQLKEKIENLFLIVAANIDSKPQITVMISENLVKEKGFNATNIVRDLAKEIQGGGGGQPFYATAGGKDLSGLDKVVKKAKELKNIKV